MASSSAAVANRTTEQRVQVVGLGVLTVVEGSVLLAAAVIWAASVDIVKLTGLATALGAVGTFAAVAVAARQLMDQREVAAFTSSRDALWRFSDEWEAIAPARQGLKKAISEGTFHGSNPQDHDNAIDVLNFFDGLGFMANRGHIDDEMSWNWFYEEARYVWDKLEAHISYERGSDPVLWCEYPIWLERIERIEERKQREAAAAQTQSSTGTG